MIIRALARDEIERVWTIDRSEVIDRIYVLRDGELVAQPVHHALSGWPPGEAETYTPLLQACFDRGGAFLGAFDGEALVGVVVVDTRLLGPRGDLLQLKFLHVSRAYRGQGLGERLFAAAQAFARDRGAGGLYVSATPSENTLSFYQQRGCVILDQPDPELFALEPEDIHLQCPL